MERNEGLRGPVGLLGAMRRNLIKFNPIHICLGHEPSCII